MPKEIKKVVLAYSGGLDTSVIISWLIENYKCDVVAFIANIGQGEDFDFIEKKALRTGAKQAIIADLREEFAKGFCFPMLRANAVYETGYLMGTSIARPLIAKAQMNVARRVKADAVAHGATGKGNDQVRFELTYLSIDPKMKIIAPWREWDFKSRGELIEYANKKGIPVSATVEKPYSSDENLFHISFEGGILEDPWAEPPEDMFILTRSIKNAPDKERYIEIEYKNGDPVALDGKRLSPADLILELNRIGGENGIGRVDIVENRFVGMKSRGVYETPGATILHTAHKAIESITMDREVMRIRDPLIPKYSELIYYGFWFSPERQLLQKLIDESQINVTGTVRLKLYKGNVLSVGRKSKFSLFSHEFATFEKDTVYNQSDATGFINLNALRLRIRAMLKRR